MKRTLAFLSLILLATSLAHAETAGKNLTN